MLKRKYCPLHSPGPSLKTANPGRQTVNLSDNSPYRKVQNTYLATEHNGAIKVGAWFAIGVNIFGAKMLPQDQPWRTSGVDFEPVPIAPIQMQLALVHTVLGSRSIAPAVEPKRGKAGTHDWPCSNRKA